MTGSLQTKANTYYVVLNIRDEDGKRRQKWISTHLSSTKNNKRKAEQEKIRILQEWQRRLLFNSDVLFSDYLKQWLEDTKHTISENTYYSYKNTIHNSICPYFEQMKIKLYDLKPFHIQDFYSYKMRNDGVSGNTIWHYHANISKALKYAYQTEKIDSNPADKVWLPKKEKHIAKFYSVDELKTLLEGAKDTKIETVVYFAAWFGLRRGEIIGLKWSSVDFENKTLSIVGRITDKGESGSKIENIKYREGAKTSSSVRTFPMTDEIVNYLKELKEKQDKQRKRVKLYNHKWNDYICVDKTGDIISPDYVTRAFPKLCEKCGLRRITLHELRHTNISLLVESNVPMKKIQEWAGHSSYNTTANIYAHIQTESKVELAQTLQSLIC